ncbi:MAG: hypothetical protein WA906_04535 [Pacificimonas sp.]
MSQYRYHFEVMPQSHLTAKTLILSLLSASTATTHTAESLVRAGDLFGIEPTAIRVALTRMTKTGLLTSETRGVYGPGPKTAALTTKLRDWETVLSRTHDWHGDWTMVLVAHVGRSDRKQARSRDRALSLGGYAELPEQAWVRPANLVGSLAAQRTDLIDIGLDDAATLLTVEDVAAASGPDWRTLWPTDHLALAYDEAIRAMDASLANLDRISPQAAARETLLIGQSVIRLINFDPLLPAEIGDADRFRKLVAVMTDYNRAGVALWRRLGII